METLGDSILLLLDLGVLKFEILNYQMPLALLYLSWLPTVS
jgi:hypothetical protein